MKASSPAVRRRRLAHEAAVRAREALGLVTYRVHNAGPRGFGELTAEDWDDVAARARRAEAYARDLARFAAGVAGCIRSDELHAEPYELNYLTEAIR